MFNPLRWRHGIAGKPQPLSGADRKSPAGSLVAAGEVRVSIHDDGLALFDISTGKVFLCNETGSLIWQGIVAGLSPDAICEEISREFGVAVELVSRQTSSFVAELESRGLVVRRRECRV
jgi:coenzyme PQQ synthesis protein D (PqqD)